MGKMILPFLAVFTLALTPVGNAAPAKSAPVATGEKALTKQIPPTLEPWRDWATWDVNTAPPEFSNAGQRFPFWPARLALQADAKGAQFDITVDVFREAWFPLPGGDKLWPVQVKANGAAIPVTLHDGHPALHLMPGKCHITGAFLWAEIPQQIAMSQEIGMLVLSIEGKPIDFPAWDSEGKVWLRRDITSDKAEKDFMSVKIYRMIQDGIPMWLHTDIELAVSGKSREEDLGGVLPEGWQLSSVSNTLPSFIDDAGRMKVQVRPGKWVIHTDAFRLNSPEQIGYAARVKPAVPDELIAFQAKPDFRLVEVTGIPAVDVSQTTFPAVWRNLPVYRWDTITPFALVERQRGMGLQKPEGLRISRQLWLDENGRGFTFRDTLNGARQEIWRLDASPGQQLGAVRSNGEGQLVTLNPKDGAPGVEIRTRNLNLEAIGRMDRAKQLAATGWQTDADALDITLMLPPGWRLFALFGADRVDGDWLTAWSLLDLFLLLIFSLAVFRLWGFGAGVIAFLAFGLSYHEADVPRYVWLSLLISIALLRVVPEGWGKRLISVWKWLTILVLLLQLIPFLTTQIQNMLYPQLERSGIQPQMASTSGSYESADKDSGQIQAQQAETRNRQIADLSPPPAIKAMQIASGEVDGSDRSNIRTFTGGWAKSSGGASGSANQNARSSNLAYDSKVRIQTGPGVPEWSWRTAHASWNGPVQSTQQIRAILIPLPLERFLSLLRVVLLLALAGVLVNAYNIRTLFGSSRRMSSAAALLVLLFLIPCGNAHAQFPDNNLLNTLKDRILPASTAFPNAAEISIASLQVQGNKITVDAEIHAALECGVPLPGRFPTWSPVTVTLDNQPATALRRENGFLWIVVPQGVHHVKVEGILPSVSDWEWAFALKPHLITVNAPDWNVSGINKDGVPESQVFFSVKQKTSAGKASYDRQDLQSLAIVSRNVEMGLVWQVHTTVRRLTPRGKAIELRIPLLPGERVLSSGPLLENNAVEVRLGTNDDSFSWDSEISETPFLVLKTNAADKWLECWILVASPVWNLGFTGIAPVFEQNTPMLIPVWHPWPGEQVTWNISRPEAVKGATVTIDSVHHQTDIGSRQRTGQLNLRIRSSLGEDFAVATPPNAQITSLTQDGKSSPVRIEGGKIVIPLHPGAQNVEIKWTVNKPLTTSLRIDEVRLPVESANVNTTIQLPENRWTLWTCGPLRGPAVRFWTVLLCALVAGFILGRSKHSPLTSFQWMILSIGLTQIALEAAFLVVAWLFLFAWRGTPGFQGMRNWVYNVLQAALIIITAIVLGIFIGIVSAGLLGSPEMFILGNDSSATTLSWYLARCTTALPQPGCITISIWWYRFLMLVWALWLATSLLHWLHWAWKQFTTGGAFRKQAKKIKPVTPPVPPAAA